tara:strand:- start:256 stop:687 length:432 start_codon:yes stop_codon:yes gene_type:complete
VSNESKSNEGDLGSNSSPQSSLDESPNSDKVSSLKELSSQEDNRFECRGCGYVYDSKEGIKKLGIPVGTTFLDLDPAKFKCPVCRFGKDAFKDIGPRSQPSGFEENLNYGFGINKLTEGQKNVLIFGGLAFAFACFLSLYSLN